MKQFDFTVVGTAATVSVLRVKTMPESGKSTPVFSGSLMEYSNGGMGFNICAGLAALGAAVYPVLTYADARQRAYLHQFAREHGMPEDGLHDPPPTACGTTIMIQDQEKNHMTLVTEYENRQADSTFYGWQKMEPHFFSNSRYVILTAPMAMNTMAAITAIRESGKSLVFSMRKDPSALPPEAMKQAMELTEYLFANESEMEYLKELFGLKDICQLFDSGKMRCIVQTLGSKGSRVYTKEDGILRVTEVGAIPPECDEIETVGAGDGYVCGFLSGLIWGRDIRDCALLGGTMSSFVLEKEGSVSNLPTKERLLARYEKYRKGETV